MELPEGVVLAFCPTGEGGGVDPTCPSNNGGGSSGGSGSAGKVHSKYWPSQQKAKLRNLRAKLKAAKSEKAKSIVQKELDKLIKLMSNPDNWPKEEAPFPKVESVKTYTPAERQARAMKMMREVNAERKKNGLKPLPKESFIN